MPPCGAGAEYARGWSARVAAGGYTSDASLARTRRSWRCGCDGESDRLPGRVANDGVEGASEAIEEVTGERPQTCPWWSVESALVREVMGVHAAIVHEVAAATLDMEALPNRVAEGVRVYTMALARSRNERDARRTAARRDGSDE